MSPSSLSERKAVYYGRVELIPGIQCDGYVLDDGTTVMSENGAAKLLTIDQAALNRMMTNWPPTIICSYPIMTTEGKKRVKSISHNVNPIMTTCSSSMMTTESQKQAKSMTPNVNPMMTTEGMLPCSSGSKKLFVKVTTQNSPYCGRKIVVYDSATIEELIRAYTMALSQDRLQKNQMHIGKRAAWLATALMRTALESAIKEACGLPLQIQKAVQRHYTSAVEMIQQKGFVCSAAKDIATKQDMMEFLQVPRSTLEHFLWKYRQQVHAIPLPVEMIRSLGSKAPRMNGYAIDDVAKIAFAMDTQVGIALKQEAFGEIGAFFDPEIKDETNWRVALGKVFQGFGISFNHEIGPYRVDFYIAKLGLVLECNGYCHHFYDPTKEAQREKYILEQGLSLVRFHHQISWEMLCNGILKARPGKTVRLYDVAKVN